MTRRLRSLHAILCISVHGWKTGGRNAVSDSFIVSLDHFFLLVFPSLMVIIFMNRIIPSINKSRLSLFASGCDANDRYVQWQSLYALCTYIVHERKEIANGRIQV